MMKLGLIGCGTVVHNSYAPTLLGRGLYGVTHVFDPNALQASSAARLFGATATSLEQLLDSVDGVIITAPPSLHAELVRASLREGRTVLCEKPFVTSAAAAKCLVADATAASTRLYVSQFRRLFPQVILAHDIIALGTIGVITGFAASEGGRFTWNAVSRYTSHDPKGGVAWDTGAHTADMALYVSGLDSLAFTVSDVSMRRDKPEPSHEIRAGFTLDTAAQSVRCSLALSRKRVLSNTVRVRGERGEVAFSVGMDTKVRVTTLSGSKVFTADRSHSESLECFDLQLRRIFEDADPDIFEARRFIGQIKLLEALTDA